MKKITPTSLLVLLILFTNWLFVNAQETNQQLANSFSTIVKNSSSYKNYKVIDKEAIAKFQSTLTNSVIQVVNEKQLFSNQMKAKDNKISALQEQIAALQNANTELLAGAKSIGFLGLSINKTVYSVAVWLLIFGLIGFSAILFLNYKRANEITESSKSILQELEDEYVSFRRICIERELNLKRKLFNEIKKTESFRDAS